MKTIYVIMGNDYPEAAFSEEKRAEAFVAKMKGKLTLLDGTPARPTRIHWRYYSFELDKDPL